MAADPEKQEKTDELVTAYLMRQKKRLSGSAFKIVFEVALRWRFSPEREVRVSIPAFADETGLSENTVRAALGEALTAKAISQRRASGNGFAYTPNFEGVQILLGAEFEGAQNLEGSESSGREKSSGAELFELWLSVNPPFEGGYSEPEREAVERILRNKTLDECEQAVRGFAIHAPGTPFVEIFASPDSVEQGMIFYEFSQTDPDRPVFREDGKGPNPDAEFISRNTRDFSD